MKIVNPGITMRSRNALALNWEDPKGIRYHVWLHAKTFEETIGGMSVGKLHDKIVIYKNPPAEIKRGDPDHFNTRYMDGSSTTNAAIIGRVRKMVDIPALVKAALDGFEREELDRGEQDRLAYIERCKEEAGPALYGAIVEALTYLAPEDGFKHDAVEHASVITRLRTAIITADADATKLTAKAFV